MNELDIDIPLSILSLHDRVNAMEAEFYHFTSQHGGAARPFNKNELREWENL
jgi:hypothetical protein